MIPELALGIVLEALKAFNGVWAAMTPEQRAELVTRGIADEKAVRDGFASFVKALGIEA
jgi:hypothetical protein